MCITYGCSWKMPVFLRNDSNDETCTACTRSSLHRHSKHHDTKDAILHNFLLSRTHSIQSATCHTTLSTFHSGLFSLLTCAYTFQHSSAFDLVPASEITSDQPVTQAKRTHHKPHLSALFVSSSLSSHRIQTIHRFRSQITASPFHSQLVAPQAPECLLPSAPFQLDTHARLSVPPGAEFRDRAPRRGRARR